MASSSLNPSKELDNQNNEANQPSTTSDEKQQNDLSPHLLKKRSVQPFSAQCEAASPAINALAFASRGSPVNRARPFEEILIGQPGTDIPPGSITKPGDNNSSFNSRLA